jgi:hypothetical protein
MALRKSTVLGKREEISRQRYCPKFDPCVKWCDTCDFEYVLSNLSSVANNMAIK